MSRGENGGFAARAPEPVASANATSGNPVRTRMSDSVRSLLVRLGPHGKLPIRAHEVARVPVRIMEQVVLMLGLRLPEGAGRLDFGYDLTRPNARGIDVGDRV